VYSLCTHGMNRSGLVTGLFLRGLGVDAEEAVALIRAARPGALSNESFVRLLRE
jgi:protein-tyrosine phosphatase